MKGEWLQCTLADACSSIDYGLTASSSNTTFGPLFLRITDIVGDGIQWSTVPHVDCDENSVEKYRVSDGDIVLARTGASTGASAYIESPPEAVFASYLVRLKASIDFDARFLSYYLKSPPFLNYIRGVLGDKSAQPNASATTMTMAPLRAPKNKQTQRAIASVLSALDDKIELNRKISATLEAIPRALFKSWFVDFDPVHAKAEGRDTGLAAEIAGLFPGSFEDSELGLIPSGWYARCLGDVLTTFECGYRPRGGVSNFKSGVPSVGAESIVGIGLFDFSKTKFVPREFFESMRRGICNAGDVLLYKDGGTPGKYEPHTTMVGENFPFDEFGINEHVYRLRGSARAKQPYLYLHLTSENTIEELRRKGTGVAVPGLNSTALASVRILEPSQAVSECFDLFAGPTLQSVLVRASESRTLALIRDLLLPKLISGELPVRDAERVVEQAV